MGIRSYSEKVYTFGYKDTTTLYLIGSGVIRTVKTDVYIYNFDKVSLEVVVFKL